MEEDIMTPTSPLPLDERLRNLEILKYGCNIRFAVGEWAPPSHSTTGSQNDYLQSARLSADATLTGFAQLAALRMNCRYAFISLIDARVQHVLAEATQTISPFDASIHDDGDALLLGVTSLQRRDSISTISLAAFAGDATHWTDTHCSFADASRHVVADVQADPRLADVATRGTSKAARFYAEVPLINQSKLVVGTICVTDSAQRPNPASIDVRALQDIAHMTVDHFELIRLKDVNSRAERLMQGLRHFNTGASSISQWVMDNPDQVLADDVENHEIQLRRSTADREEKARRASVADGLAHASSESQDASTSNVLQAQPQVTPEGPSDDIKNSSQAVHSDVPTNRKVSPERDQKDGLLTFSYGPRSFHARSSDRPAASKTSTATSAATSVRSVFARATNILRESMNLDGTCFLEMSPGSRAKMSGVAESLPDDQTQSTKPQDVSSSGMSEQDDKRVRESSTRRRQSYFSQNGGSVLAKRLAYSILQKSTLAKSTISSESLTLPEEALVRLSSKYPNGRIFHFDAFGALSSGDDLSHHSRHSARKRLASVLGRCFPGARSIIFMPMYDNDRHRLYAAFIGYTSDPFRALVKNESIYISGFTNSVMCEVMRLEALALERSKSEFVSSISHELRSPLHGILSATQLLEETELDSSQRELAVMVDSCGQTLLDIMNNLLVFAKINHVFENRGQQNTSTAEYKQLQAAGSSAGSTDMAPPPPKEQIDVAALVEETVTAVAAGHAVRERRLEEASGTRRKTKQASSRVQRSRPNSDRGRSGQEQEAGSPSVIIDMQYRENWLLDTDAGSWRRIVMNLVGNALKYTERGFVHVKLEAQDTDQTSEGRSMSQVVLTVSDSGQGISPHYMQHRLYTPFAQENSLSVGVGLGLSIVNRIVTSMNGNVDIESEVDVGTTATVDVPLEMRPQRPTMHRMDTHPAFASVRQLSRAGDVCCFVGFDVSLSGIEMGSMEHLHVLTLQKTKRSLINLTHDWFGLPLTDTQEEASIVMIEQSHAIKLFKDDPTNLIFTKKYVVVTIYDNADMERTIWSGRYYGIAAPIGPHKLARMLAFALQQQENTPEGERERIEYIQQGSREMWSSSGIRKPSQDVDRAGTEGEQCALPPTAPQEPAQEESSHEATPSVRDAGPDSGNYLLLLVDDNDINLRILENLVKKLNLTSLRAQDGQQALDQYVQSYEQGRPVDYVFMDISMPIMDGLESTRRIREYEKSIGREQPAEIFALTGLGHEDIQRQARASGIDQYFTKPVKLKLLKNLLGKNGA